MSTSELRLVNARFLQRFQLLASQLGTTVKEDSNSGFKLELDNAVCYLSTDGITVISQDEALANSLRNILSSNSTIEVTNENA